MKEVFKERLGTLDDVMLAAITEVTSEIVESNRPMIVSGDDDEIIGQKYRAYVEAERICKQILGALASYRPNRQINNNFNKYE